MKTKILRTIALTFLLVAAMAATGTAATYNLRADRVNVTMPDGAVVPAWGFADDTAGPGTVTVPGPQLVVPAGDTSLTINLTNNLPVPVSIHIPGQFYTTTPNPTTASGRVLSFNSSQAAASGGTSSITINNLRSGTFRYESGTHPAMEVPMGLYGALVVRPAAAGQAYNNVSSAYDNETIALFSEIDPAFNAYVDANGTIVDAVNKINYSISFAPKYFLINGKAFPETADISAPTGQRMLLRMINAGSRTYAPTIQDTEFTVIAEDGYLLNFSRHEFAPSLPAGKTLDLIMAPAAIGYRPFYDRRLGMANAGVFPGGMLTFIGDLNCRPVKGDVTGDGTITAADALTVLRAYVGGTTGTLPVDVYGPVADVSLDPASGLPCGDGNIGLDDVLGLLQKAIGMDAY